MAARDEAEGGNEDRDDEPVRQRDVRQRPCEGDSGAPDEDQRERPDELSGAPAQVVPFQHEREPRTRVGRTQIMNAPLLCSIACPVTPTASGERSHATVPAISPGSLIRRSGT